MVESRIAGVLALSRRRIWHSALALIVLSLGSLTSGAAQYQGWDITRERMAEKSPLAGKAEAATRGQTLFRAHCARCHGLDGKGQGPDSDHAADLTDEYRNEINPEGVLFYKVWKGHAIQLRTQVDDMPPFEGKLTREEVWSIVEYLKALRVNHR
jgi:mono/diheme cytochrome c family protein